MRSLRPIILDPADHAALRDKILRNVNVVDMSVTYAERTRRPEGSCWCMPITMWDSGDGYKKVRWRGKGLYVHRALYTIDVGPIPDGMVLDHLCRVRRCCNPAHMEPVTVAENSERGLWVNHQFVSSSQLY